MILTILGSGGAIRIPKACCNCPICHEARIKGFPYKRLGQSLYINDENILFDTPEDINEELNCHNINNIDYIFYSHWHPDHTLGCRVIESIMDGKENTKLPIKVHMPKGGIDITINNNSLFTYYESIRYADVIMSDDDVKVNDIKIRKIRLKNEFAYAFLIEEGERRVLYCPCHTMHLPKHEELFNVDLMIVSKGYSSILNDEYTNFERDTLNIINDLKPKKVIITHIEETDGIGFDDYKELEKSYKNIKFAYDGMIIEV